VCYKRSAPGGARTSIANHDSTISRNSSADSFDSIHRRQRAGNQASVWFGTVARGDMFYIRIGDRTNVQDNCVLHTRTGELPTILEDEVTVGHSVTLHGCYVEHGSLIGIGSILLDDVRIGAQSLVAAGSLVSPGTIIPPRSLVMGMPARVKRPLTDEEVLSLDRYWQNYVEYSAHYLNEPK
jgi:carbonic anhydrase/acetyltransferase-like protein (isoleucine patch superfamily)